MRPEQLDLATLAVLAGRQAGQPAQPATSPLVSTSLFEFASTAELLKFYEQGDHVIAAHQLYPGTHNFFQHLAPKLQVEVTRVQADDLSQVSKALKPSTKLLFWESPTNPSLYLADLSTLAQLAYSVGALLAVDNTSQLPATSALWHSAQML